MGDGMYATVRWLGGRWSQTRPVDGWLRPRLVNRPWCYLTMKPQFVECNLVDDFMTLKGGAAGFVSSLACHRGEGCHPSGTGLRPCGSDGSTAVRHHRATIGCSPRRHR